MQQWPLPSTTTGLPGRHTSALIDCIARPGFAQRAMAALNEVLPVAWWTVYEVGGDAAVAGFDEPPRLRLQASHERPDVTLACWHIYRSGVYRQDKHLAAAQRSLTGRDAQTAVLSHCRADDFSGAHRDAIYRAHGLSERLSLVSAGRAGIVRSINLYRHRGQPRFAADEIDALHGLALPLLAVVGRQLELEDDSADADRPAVERAARTLRRRCPELTPREFEVCERLLRGWTHEGIGADLGVSVTTVKTYRNRAFQRLGIHHRNQLFGLALQDEAPHRG